MFDIGIKCNFFSEEQCNSLLNYYDIKNYSGNDMVYFDNSENYANIKKMKIQGDLVSTTTERIGINSERCVGCSLVYYAENSYNPLHADNCIINGDKITKVKDWTLTAIIFLNNSYDGGELIYPNQGLVLKPPVGTLILVPTDHNYIHMVNPITSGERFTLVFRFV